MMTTWLLLFILVVPVPPPPVPPQPPPEAALDLLRRLGCECSTERGVMQCQRLPAFGDNEWTHDRPKEFIAEGRTLVAQLGELSPKLPSPYHLALQGSADSREIMHVKSWSEASVECRSGHVPTDKVSNRDLAFLRACELRRLFPLSIAPNIALRPPIDYTNPAIRKGSREAYKGEKYKAVTLFIVFPDRSLCGSPKHPRE